MCVELDSQRRKDAHEAERVLPSSHCARALLSSSLASPPPFPHQLRCGTYNTAVSIPGHMQEMEMDRMGDGAQAESSPPMMSRDMLDRLIVARLIESPPADYPQTPVQYLLGCYQRADDEMRNRTVAGSPQLSGTEQCCRDLVVNYAGLTLSGGIVPHLGAAVSGEQQ